MTLVLSLFPGIGLLDRAFEEEGFCVVRGPDVLWGGDVRTFHPPEGHFDGIIGGPPCQTFSGLANLVRSHGRETTFGNLIPEFERVVLEANPIWFLMENVPSAPPPWVASFWVKEFLLDNRWLGEEQRRRRRFCFGVRGSRAPNLMRLIKQTAPHPHAIADTVTAAHAGEKRPKGGKLVRYTLPEACRLQGLPEDFLEHAPFNGAGQAESSRQRCTAAHGPGGGEGGEGGADAGGPAVTFLEAVKLSLEKFEGRFRVKSECV